MSTISGRLSTYSGKRLSTSINITCIDRDGNIVKRVTTDGGDVEDGEENENENQGGSGNSGNSGNSGSTGGGGGVDQN